MQAILSHPLALVKLGMFLRDVAAMRQTKKRKPIVLVGPADAQGNCLVVAVTCEPMSGEAVQVCQLLAIPSLPSRAVQSAPVSVNAHCVLQAYVPVLCRSLFSPFNALHAHCNLQADASKDVLVWLPTL